MHIELKRVGSPFQFEAKNESGNTVQLDAAKEIGGTEKGARPMELFIMGLGGCTAIDVVMILEKQRQKIDDIDIKIDADRDKMEDVSLFSKINIEYIIKGQIDEEKLTKAIELSLNKYCSAAKTLEKTAAISYTYRII